jgi:hypothetical protein
MQKKAKKVTKKGQLAHRDAKVYVDVNAEKRRREAQSLKKTRSRMNRLYLGPYLFPHLLRLCQLLL